MSQSESFQKALELYKGLKSEFTKPGADLVACSQQLGDLKVILTEITLLPTNQSEQNEQEFVLTRDVLEIGAHLSILKKDIPSFSRYMAQLKPYYLDYGLKSGASPYKQQLLGLNLLCLLSQNRVAEFHTELERLSIHDILNSVYIQHPICIEQYLMEGNYNKLFLAKGNVPAKNYSFFMNILLDTIRDEIADCMETSYTSIAVDECKRMLYFESSSSFKRYVVKRNWNQDQSSITFLPPKSPEEGAAQLASVELAQQMLGYARELEMII